MTVSVVMSSYNGEKYIKEQLESLLMQTRKIDEVIIADDCSSDNTVTIVEDFIQDNNLSSSWRIIVNKKNKGWRRNFMEAMWLSKGDLVFPCDQDDIWRKDKVEIMSNIMENNPEINLLTSNYCEFFVNGKERIDPWKNDKQLKKIDLRYNYLLVDSPGCTYCVRRKLLDMSKKYWRPAYPHDALLWRMGLMSNSLYAYTDDLIRWRNHRSSAFAKESKDLKSVSAKKDWIKVSNEFNSESIRKFIDNDVEGDTAHQQAVIDRNNRWLAKRKQFYETRNVFSGISLLKYLGCYPRLRQYLGDWYLIYFKSKGM